MRSVGSLLPLVLFSLLMTMNDYGRGGLLVTDWMGNDVG